MAGHFYTPDATPAHEGGLVAAKKDGNYPSVTTIERILDKKGLRDWYARQVLMSALTLPRRFGETDESYTDRIIEDAGAASGRAAEIGTIIHDSIERHLVTREPFDPHLPAQYAAVVASVVSFLNDNSLVGYSEVSFANHDYGYGGRIDFIGHMNERPVILDFKTQFAKDHLVSGIPKFVTYQEHAFQLSAYRYAIMQTDILSSYDNISCRNLLISSNPDIPGTKLKLWPYTHARYMDIETAFKVFTALLNLYRLLHRFPHKQRAKTGTTLLNEVYNDNIDGSGGNVFTDNGNTEAAS